MDNPGQCSICFTDFDESERRPRTVPCGHTFCSPCIGDMMEGGQLSCPTCRASHSATFATQFPINYNTEAFVKQLQALKLTASLNVKEVPAESLPPAAGVEGPQVISRRLRSLLEEQKGSVGNLAKGSQALQSQLDQYRAQLADWNTQHHDLLSRLYDLVEQNKAVLKLLELEDTRVLAMKKEGEKGEKQLKTTLGCLNTVNTAQEVVTAIDHTDQFIVVVEDWIQKCEEQFPDTNTIITSKKVQEITSMALDTWTDCDGAAAAAATEVPVTVNPASTILEKVKEILAQLQHSSVKDLLKVKPRVRWLVEASRLYVVKGKDRNYSSKITIEDDRLYFHCLSNQSPPSDTHTVLVSEVLGALDLSSTLVFLDLVWAPSKRGRIHIRLSPDTLLARQFIMHCIGQSGTSFLNDNIMVMYNHEQGQLLHGPVKVFLPVTFGGRVISPVPQSNRSEAGSVFCLLPGQQLAQVNTFQFAILTSDSPIHMNYPKVFGQVEKGLEVVQAVINPLNLSPSAYPVVADCGIIVPF